MWGYPKIAILVRKMIRNKALNCLGGCPMFKQSHVRKAGTSPWKQQKMKHINLLVHLLYYEIKSDLKNNTIQYIYEVFQHINRNSTGLIVNPK